MKNKSSFQLLVMALLFLTSCSSKYGGLALYTVRDDMKTDAKGSLKKIADIGYKNIESAGYDKGKFYGMTPVEFKTYVKE